MQIRLAGVERRLAHPDDHRVEAVRDLRRVGRVRQHVAAADVYLVGQAQHDRLRREGLVELAVVGVDGADLALRGPCRQHDRDAGRPF
jgi:hypothetical protein